VNELHILNLGAGVQSTALYLMEMEHIWGLRFDYSIFADTKNEPKKVYQHLKWLRSLNGSTILTGSKGSLLSDLLVGQKTTKRSASIPSYTKGPNDTKEGMTKRQCTKEYKTDVIYQIIRRNILGLGKGQRVPKDVIVHQYFGISTDESRRMSKIIKRLPKWSVGHFPFIDHGWGRRGIQEWLKDRVPHDVPRSACKICPLRNDHEWAEMKQEEPTEFKEACDLDDKLREPGTVCNRGMDNPMYLHRSCIPLKLVDFDNLPPQQLDGFTLYDCSGACGN
jgi:hypothetical protein